MPLNTLEEAEFASVEGKVDFGLFLCSVRCKVATVYFLLGTKLQLRCVAGV